MNKIFNINLGGYPFTIDEDAYQQLCRYLDTIHSHFKSSEGYEDITSDIETRMAELITESMQNRQIVVQKDVQTAIAIMGSPEEFGANGDEEEPILGEQTSRSSTTGSGAPQEPKSFGMKTGKKLMRNPEDTIIGGVCSGIAAYFGITDPVWIRLVFVAFVAAGGSGVLLYFILWAILKPAKSSADFLAMRGEPINVNNIARVVEKEFDNISESFSNFGDKKKRSHFASGLGNFLSTAFSFAGQILHSIIVALGKLTGKIGIVLGIFGIIVISFVCIAMFFGSVMAFPIIDFVIPASTTSKVMGMGNLIFLSLIPVVSAILLLLRTFFRIRISSGWHLGMWAFWLLNGVMLGVAGSKIAKSFNVKESLTETMALPNPNADTISIGFAANPYQQSVKVFDLKYADKRLASEDISLEIKKSNDQLFHLEKVISSRGGNREEARSLASKVNIPVEIQGNRIVLPTFYELQEGETFRGQSVHFTLSVPESKLIFIEDADDVLWPYGDFDYDKTCDDTHSARTYRMEKGLMICADPASKSE
ncbi:MAG: PspC domain-containing protein [Saprospiraceae bacterium]